MKWQLTVALAILGASAMGAAEATTITFDTDAGGNPLAAPSLFVNTSVLRDLYAPLGVLFDGTANSDGGAILDQSANFGVNALSGDNLLGFNASGTTQDGDTPAAPQLIDFTVPVNYVSLYAAGGFNVGTFQLDVYDSSDVLLASDTYTGQDWGQLSVWANDISYAIFSTSGDVEYAADNLTFELRRQDVIPEPATMTLLGLGLSGLALRNLRKRS
jgi:hypothetical protein